MRLPILIALAALSTPALAECGDFALASDGSQRTVVFTGGDSAQVGDRRIGRRAVTRDGAPAGTHHWISTVHELHDTGTLTDQTGVFRLDGGTLHYSSLWDRTRPVSDTEVPGGSGHTAVITGGTGAYQHATGSLTTNIDGMNVSYAFTIRCD